MSGKRESVGYHVSKLKCVFRSQNTGVIAVATFALSKIQPNPCLTRNPAGGQNPGNRFVSEIADQICFKYRR